MSNLREAIIGAPDRPGYWQDMRRLPVKMRELYIQDAQSGFDKNTKLGWRGPYVTSTDARYGSFDPAYGLPDDPAAQDAWGRPVVIQIPNDASLTTDDERSRHARLISAGPDGIIQTPISDIYPLPADRGDDVVLFLRKADAAP
jgi:hypothetical protein